MKLSEAKEVIKETIERFGNAPGLKVINYRIDKNLSKNLEACISGTGCDGGFLESRFITADIMGFLIFIPCF